MSLHHAWANREPVAVVLAVDAATFRTPASHPVEPWQLDAGFELWLDRLQFLVWANTYDVRGTDERDEPVWWWARKAERLGAKATPGGPADVVLPDGRAAWVDGGPRRPFALAEEVVHRESVELGVLRTVPRPTDPTAPLAPDQLAAVAHDAGPARVIAPAGSGKTRVLTERLRHLLVDRAYERPLVLGVAYNVKAREEMEERLRELAPRVQTLNGLGYGIVATALGQRPTVLDVSEVRRIIQGLVPARPRRVNTDPIEPYIEALGSIRLGLRDPAHVQDSREREAHALNTLWDRQRGLVRLGQGLPDPGRAVTVLEERGPAADGAITTEGISLRERIERDTDHRTGPLYAELDQATRDGYLAALIALPGTANPGIPGT